MDAGSWKKQDAWSRNYSGDIAKDTPKSKRKLYWWPALASWIIPGLGQWIKGESAKGFCIFVTAVFLFIMSYAALLLRPIFVVLAALLSIANILDALSHKPGI